MYIIVEIFPFKNELAEILYKYGVKVIAENRSPAGKNKKGKLITQFKDLKDVLFAIQLMYLSSEEKHRKKINKFAQKSNKFYYNVDTSKEKSEYISSMLLSSSLSFSSTLHVSPTSVVPLLLLPSRNGRILNFSGTS